MRKFDAIIGYNVDKKKLLTTADIQEIKVSCKIVPVTL